MKCNSVEQAWHIYLGLFYFRHAKSNITKQIKDAFKGIKPAHLVKGHGVTASTWTWGMFCVVVAFMTRD